MIKTTNLALYINMLLAIVEAYEKLTTLKEIDYIDYG
jgi:hypothetical protein